MAEGANSIRQGKGGKLWLSFSNAAIAGWKRAKGASKEEGMRPNGYGNADAVIVGNMRKPRQEWGIMYTEG